MFKIATDVPSGSSITMDMKGQIEHMDGGIHTVQQELLYTAHFYKCSRSFRYLGRSFAYSAEETYTRWINNTSNISTSSQSSIQTGERTPYVLKYQ